ncbi:MAG: single-stranded-DNA-specific exonuclease RecJ [Thermoguttaceae bacterium]
MPKKWTVRPTDSDLVASLVRSAHLPDWLATLLVGRNLTTSEAAEAFLNPTMKEQFRLPFLLPGCKNVAEHLFRAIQSHSRIAVYGDYDVDGMTGTVILYQAIRDFGGDVSYYIPSRLDEGYGLNSDAISKLHKDGVKTIITVDCGISSLEEAKLARELGVELLITDHHNPGELLPDAVAIAHPQLVWHDNQLVSPSFLAAASHSESETSYSEQKKEKQNKSTCYPFPHLCGAAVALKIAWGLGQIVESGEGCEGGKCRESGEKVSVSPAFRNRLCQLVGLAVLGTIADSVPLLDENRAMVYSGLQFLLPPYSTPGMAALFQKAKFVHDRTKLDTDFASFQLIPRMNAAGRFGQAGLAVELLLTDNSNRAEQLAEEIDHLNTSRRSLEKEILAEADKQIAEKFHPDQDSAFVLVGDWHKGVLGLVANRIAEKYHRPAILFGHDPLARAGTGLVGSARSVQGFNLYAAIDACSEYLVRFGGHDGAAGLTILPEQVAAFREAFCLEVANNRTEESWTSEIEIDGFFPLGAFTRQTLEQIGRLAPFGVGNRSPIFAASKVTVKNAGTMGHDQSHFAATFEQGGMTIRGIAFSRRHWIEDMQPYSEAIDIAFIPRISNFTGNIELEILDWRR